MYEPVIQSPECVCEGCGDPATRRYFADDPTREMFVCEDAFCIANAEELCEAA